MKVKDIKADLIHTFEEKWQGYLPKVENGVLVIFNGESHYRNQHYGIRSYIMSNDPLVVKVHVERRNQEETLYYTVDGDRTVPLDPSTIEGIEDNGEAVKPGTYLPGHVETETGKAILLVSRTTQQWIPKSQITGEDDGGVYVSEWFARKLGILEEESEVEEPDMTRPDLVPMVDHGESREVRTAFFVTYDAEGKVNMAFGHKNQQELTLALDYIAKWHKRKALGLVDKLVILILNEEQKYEIRA